MKFPRLKNALMCRTLVYVIVIGGFIAPIIIAANFSFLPDALKGKDSGFGRFSVFIF
ncbi:MAG: hypothetical protein ACI4LI_01620 [Candidatus Fimenecus sp.]